LFVNGFSSEPPSIPKIENPPPSYPPSKKKKKKTAQTGSKIYIKKIAE